MTRYAARLSCLTLCTMTLFFVAGSSAAHEGHDEEGAVQAMVIAAVVPGGPAAAAGLAEGDRIVDWDGEALRTQADIDKFLGTRQPGDIVPLTIDRNGETMEVDLTLGDRGDGGPRLGISLGVEASSPATATSETAAADKVTSDECRAWIDDTYRVEALAAEFGLDIDERLAETRACVDGDLAVMPPSIPRGWCDNVFKVHCSGLDLLAEIGDAVVDRCESQLTDSLGSDVAHDKTWNVCGEQRVFDAYSREGKVSDATSCRRILVDECGADLEGSGGR